jgi:hypothetical protein
MKRNLEIGTRVNGWTVISEPIIENGKRQRKLKCDCGKEEIISESFINRAKFSKSCRSCSQIRRRNEDGKRIYNIGDIIMNLEILKIHSGKYVSYTVKCNKCGNIYRTGHSILCKKSKGLGLACCHKCFNVDMKSRKSCTMTTKNISLIQYKKLQRQAELRGIEFNVTPEYLESIFTGYCYFSGIELKIGTYMNNKGVRDLGNASLDRIDSSIGYVEGNVAWVYKPINIMKQTLSSAEFINLCKKITNHNQ